MKYSEDIKELIKERISVMPENLRLSVGNYGTFNKEQILNSIEKGDKVGEAVIEMQLNFIRALTSGKLTNVLNSMENE